MFVLAYPEALDCVIYLDGYSNKYIVSGGTLAWRINNPGLVRRIVEFLRKMGRLGLMVLILFFQHRRTGLLRSMIGFL